MGCFLRIFVIIVAVSGVYGQTAQLSGGVRYPSQNGNAGAPAVTPLQSTADADPSIRHEVEVPVPTRLSVERAPDSLSISYDLASVRKIKITLGKKMAIGIKTELRVYAKGSEQRPLQPSGVGYASI